MGATAVCINFWGVWHVLKQYGLNILDNYSSRTKSPFLTINITAMSKSLIACRKVRIRV